MTVDIRWQQRLASFRRALALLQEPFSKGIDTLSQLEREGTVQRFGVTLELACKTLNDYLFYQGLEVKPVAPRAVVKEGFAAGVLSDGQVWLDMIAHRNLLAHTYEEATFQDALVAIQARYLPAMIELVRWFEARVS